MKAYGAFVRLAVIVFAATCATSIGCGFAKPAHQSLRRNRNPSLRRSRRLLPHKRPRLKLKSNQARQGTLRLIPLLAHLSP